MWHFVLPGQAKARAGISAVRKKDPTQQRKLVMACPANYLWIDVKKLYDHGMGGAAAVNHMASSGEEICVAVLDESNAFSAVRTPQWMWAYFACPNVVADDVWERLPLAFRSTVRRSDMITPLYCRLPMGSSHSVHVLMRINMTHIGRALTNRWGARLAHSTVQSWGAGPVSQGPEKRRQLP